MTDPLDCFATNQSWLLQHQTTLHAWISASSEGIVRLETDGVRKALYVNNECWLEDVERELTSNHIQQLREPDSVMTVSVQNEDDIPIPSPGEFLSSIVDSHESNLLQVLPCFQRSMQLGVGLGNAKQHDRTLAVLGSLALVSVWKQFSQGIDFRGSLSF